MTRMFILFSVFYKTFLFISLAYTLSASAISVISVKELKQKSDTVKYLKVHDRFTMNLSVFPIASSQNSTWATPIIPETFILKASKGRVYSDNGIVIINGSLVKELIWSWSSLKKDTQALDLNRLPTPKHIAGRVAVIAQEGHGNYYHWITEVLPRLALLEKKKIDYDWLYLPKLSKHFMLETIEMLGIDKSRIIESDSDTYIEADELIVPSFVARSCYTPKWVADYIEEKLIPSAPTTQRGIEKKIFISRGKASYRRITNEDGIFKMLEPLGFVKYHLEDLTVSQQISLFKNANVIVASHGAGLTNLLFCSPNTKVIEIFQQHEDDTYWYISQVLKLDHTCIKTTKFRKGGGYTDTTVSIQLVKDEVMKSLSANSTHIN